MNRFAAAFGIIGVFVFGVGGLLLLSDTSLFPSDDYLIYIVFGLFFIVCSLLCIRLPDMQEEISTLNAQNMIGIGVALLCYVALWLDLNISAYSVETRWVGEVLFYLLAAGPLLSIMCLFIGRSKRRTNPLLARNILRIPFYWLAVVLIVQAIVILLEVDTKIVPPFY
jgi:hypothetical protein